MTWLRALLSIMLAGNGLLMLIAPASWYHTIPAVSLTGPLNTHFIRDIGCAYLSAAAALLWGLLRPAEALATTLLAAVFLMSHAGVHLYELASGLCGWTVWWQAFPGVTLPGLLASALAWQSLLMRRA